MPAKGGKTSPALVGFLIFFILTTIILGVTTYLGFSGQDDLSKKAVAAQGEEKKAKQDADWFRFLAISLKSYAGFPMSGDDKEYIGPLRRDFANGTGTLVTNSRAKDKQDDVKVIQTLDKDYGWDETEKKAKVSMEDRIATLTKDLNATKKNWEAAKADADKAKKDLAEAQKQIETDQATYAAELKKRKDSFDQDLNKYVVMTRDLQTKIDDLGKEKQALTDQLDQQKAESAKSASKWAKEKKQEDAAMHKLQEKVAPVNILDYDQPKGKIVAIDRDGRMPFINLGSADHIRPGITFSVYGVGPGGKPVAHDVIGPDGKVVLGQDNKPEKEGKATIEVTSVLGEHLAQARVTSVRDPYRDPILRGDLLFNPAWSPNERQHVAIAGVVDLTGDGHDDLREFLRTLQSQGVVVDAYLDLKDLTIKGPGIDRQTDYLILGPNPSFPGQDTARDEDPRIKRQAKIIDLMNKMQEAATHNGVTIISLRKFLALTGYHVTHSTANPDLNPYGNGGTESSNQPPGGEEKKPVEKKKPAEEKKEDTGDK